MERMDLGQPLEHHMLSVNDIQLHVVFTGPEDGQPVLLLHGFPEFWYGWRHQLGPLAQAGYRVIVPDLRGYNTSGKPPGPQHYLPHVLQGDIIGLLDHLQLPQVRLIGHDWGGVLAWWLAEAVPGRLKQMVILNAPHPLEFQRTLLRQPAQLLRSGYMLFFQLPLIPEFLLRQNDFQIMVQALVRSSLPETFTRAELQHYREAWSQPGALSAMLCWYRALPYYALQPGEGGQITVPALLLWGDRDFALSRSLAAESLARCDNARLHRLPRAGHWLQHEQPTQVSQQLVAFLAEQPI